MSPLLLRAAVLLSGAVVLVVETLAARLVAPWVGLTLESHTAAIGVALAGIAAGAALGGRLADRAGPHRVVLGALTLGGVLVLTVRPVVDLAGPLVGTGPLAALLLVGVSTVAPVAALSAVTPAVARASLTGVEGSGALVGSLSALGTVGALAGTALTGFVLVALLPLGASLALAAGACLALAAAVALASARSGGPGSRAGVLRSGAAAGVAALALVAVPDRCEVDTTYHCASVVADPQRPGGRSLVLDDLRHSYVDLDDPTHLELTYTRRIADAVDATAAPGAPLSVVHLGGGGMTVPRWLAATRPGSRSTVLEVDPGVVEIARERLGAADLPGTRVVVGDARTSLREVPTGSADVVVADAFGARSVPWHLATRELVADVERVLRPDGVYVLNVIDDDPLALLRAVTVTVADVLPHVALVSAPEQLADGGGGNHVLVASARPLPVEHLADLVAPHGEQVLSGPALRRLVGDARVLTDDHAPTAQLLTSR